MNGFETQRLIVKKWAIEDAADFFELTQDKGFTLFPITNYKQESMDSAKCWIAKNIGKYAVREKTNNFLVGMGGLTPWNFEGEELIDITYRLREAAWGKGFGLELAQALVKFGFEELKLTQITATITPDNIPSKKIAEKIGLKFDQSIIYLGVPTDLYRMKVHV